jgi:hypothetical protein
MRYGNLKAGVLAGFAMLALVACGGGGGGSGPAIGGDDGGDDNGVGGIDRGGVATGAITGFGSVFVNGVRFDTANAAIMLDGATATEDDLRVGYVVVVAGQIDDDGVNGTAERVESEFEVKGPVDAVDVTSGQLTVLGRVVLAGAATLYGGGVASLDDLAALAGQSEVIVEVSGFQDSDGAIRATRIEVEDGAAAEFEARGRIQALQTAASTFLLGTLVVDYSGAVLEDFPAAGPEEGDAVEVHGTRQGDVLVATRLQREDDIRARAEDGGRVEIEGFVTSLTGSGSFEVSGVPVATASTTVFEGGSAANIALNVRVEAKGTWDGAAGVLRATRVQFEQEADLRVTGSVEAVDATGATFTAVGVEVGVTTRTSFEDDRDDDRLFGLARLSIGDWVEVRGIQGSGGELVATLVERDEADTASELRGPAADIDLAARSLTILGAAIATTPSTQYRQVDDTPITAEAFFQALATDALVRAKGTWDGTTLTAQEIEFEN